MSAPFGAITSGHHRLLCALFVASSKTAYKDPKLKVSCQTDEIGSVKR